MKLMKWYKYFYNLKEIIRQCNRARTSRDNIDIVFDDLLDARTWRRKEVQSFLHF